MATYSNIGIKLITTGDESGTWGDTTNTNFSDILDEAIAGAVTYNIASDADATLTVSDGSSSDGRHAVINFTSTTLTATRTITFAPDTLQKTWLVINSTTGGQSLTFKQGSAGATVTVPNGESAIIYSDGAGATNGAITKALDSFTNTKITTGTLNATTLDLTNLEVTNIKAKDGTAAASIADSTGVVSFTANPILSAGTANGVLYLNGSKEATSGSALTFDGTDLSTTGGFSTGNGKSISLNASSSGQTNRLQWKYTGTVYAWIERVNSNGDMAFGVQSSEAMRLTSTGLGIGTNSPATALEVKSDGAAIQVSSADYDVALLGRRGSSGVDLDKGYMRLRDTGVTKVAIDSAGNSYFNGGNVGIGTSSPATDLHIKNATDTQLLIESGTSSTGFLLFGDADDLNVGSVSYNHSDNSMRFETSDSERMRIASDGSVGIGTSSPASKLHINSGTSDQGVLIESTDTRALIGFKDNTTVTNPLIGGVADDLVVRTNNVESMRVTSAGLVGIGTSSPSQKLSVATASGNCYVDVARASKSTGQVALQLSGGTSGTNWIIYQPTNSDNLTFFGNSSDRMVLDTSGNLGLGVTPNAWYTLSKVIESDGYAFEGRPASPDYSAYWTNIYLNATGSAFVYRGNGYGTAYLQASGVHRWRTAASGTAGATATLTEFMTLDTAGRLGIGTTSPAYKLDVRGSTDTSYLNITSTADANNTTLRIGTDATAAFINATGGSSGTLQLRTYGTTKATLDNAGNLGLGVTPSAWNSLFKALDFSTTASLAGAAGSANLFNNAYWDGSQYVYKTNAEATRYLQASGEHIWYTAGSGTAGGGISFTQAMTLDASGNLGLGRTDQAYRLDVQIDGTGPYIGRFNNASTSTSQYNVVRFTQGASGSAGGYIGTGGSAVGNAAFQNTFVVGTDTANDLVFNTNDAQRARITSGGDLLVGTDNTSATTGAGFKFAPGTNPRLSIVTGSSTSATSISLYSTGAGAYRFFVDPSGTIYATVTTISSISDQRYKENIRDLDVGLDAVMALKPRKFDWKEGKGKDKKDDRGFIAQEFEQVFPDLVDEWKDPAPEGEEPYKSVRQDLIPVLVKAIQELKAELDATKAEVAALKGAN